MARHLKKDDIVEVISGDHKGERGKVLRMIPRRGLVVVEGVNMVYRHVKPSQRNPKGGRLQKEAPLRVSNVLPVDPKTNRGSRVQYAVQSGPAGEVTSKTRVTVSGTVLGEVSRSRE